MTLTYTSRLKLAVPDFLTEPWHGEFAQAMESIDRLVYDALLMQGAALWANSTAYLVGDIVISPDTGSLYTCAVANTSTASPQTFTQELVDHPTFWTITAPTLATQAEAEAGTDNTKFMSPLRTSQAIAALSSQSSLFTPKDGRLSYVSATQLNFSPFNGSLLKINGVLYTIPSAGIVGLANTNVYVNQTPLQNLVADTTYFVFAFVVGGVVTANFSSIGHRPSQTVGNEGVETMWTGVVEFPAYTLIGIIRTNASAQFQDDYNHRYVASWFNRLPRALRGTQITNNITNTSIAEIDTLGRAQFVVFDSALFAEVSGSSNCNTLNALSQWDVYLDGVTAIMSRTGAEQYYANNSAISISGSGALQVTEGFHYITPFGSVSTGTAAASQGVSGIVWI